LSGKTNFELNWKHKGRIILSGMV